VSRVRVAKSLRRGGTRYLSQIPCPPLHTHLTTCILQTVCAYTALHTAMLVVVMVCMLNVCNYEKPFLYLARKLTG
jgi:hypothetical protein